MHGSSTILAMAQLSGALNVIDVAGIGAIREKSLALTDYLIRLVDELLPECSVGTPRAPARRGGHIAVAHPEAQSIIAAPKRSEVVVDYRQPNVVRVCPSRCTPVSMTSTGPSPNSRRCPTKTPTNRSTSTST